MTKAIKMIGIGDDGKHSLLPLYEKFIEDSEVLVGGKRHLAYFSDYQGEKINIEGSLSTLIDRLQNEDRNVVILASGDPLFYGMGGYLSSKLQVEIYPNVSSIQLAFARMGQPWQGAYLTSVHGRSLKGLAQRIDGKETVAILTDAENSPNQISHYLLSFGMTEYQAFVAENLGGETERCRWFSLEEMLDEQFSPLNVVILKKIAQGPSWSMGIEDQEFIQRKPLKGLITKKEIRTLSISALKLKANSVVWDIGTCTGSVAIEAGRMAREGQVFAVEKNEADLENCRANLAKFRVDATVVQAKAPEGLLDFPDPDAVFIGGTGGGMTGILDVCCSRLKPNGRIVLNAATIENLAEATKAFKQRGFKTDITLVQISRSQPILDLTRFESLNPIYIIAAEREEGEKQC